MCPNQLSPYPLVMRKRFGQVTAVVFPLLFALLWVSFAASAKTHGPWRIFAWLIAIAMLPLAVRGYYSSYILISTSRLFVRNIFSSRMIELSAIQDVRAERFFRFTAGIAPEIYFTDGSKYRLIGFFSQLAVYNKDPEHNITTAVVEAIETARQAAAGSSA